MKTTRLFLSFCVALVATSFSVPPAEAYPTYSQDKVINPDGEEESFGNCKACHGGFRDEDYISPADGEPWSVIYTEAQDDPADPPNEPEELHGLHDIHRNVMLDKIGGSRCNVCHTRPPGFYPVLLGSSTGSDPLDGLSCGGCHGRNEDAGNDNVSEGLGAGLRQHHTNAGIKECMTCHADADPQRYTPVGEDVLPSYFTVAPNDVFVNLPTEPCNPHGEEDYAGGRQGLDNDGDGLYDKRDPDCRPIGPGDNHGLGNR